MNFLAAGLIIAGYFLIARRSKIGFGVQSIGCAIYIFQFLEIDWSIVITNGIFVLVNIYGYVKWSKAELPANS